MQENKKHSSFAAVVTFLWMMMTIMLINDDVSLSWSYFLLNTESTKFYSFLYQWLWLKVASYLVQDSVNASVTKIKPITIFGTEMKSCTCIQNLKKYNIISWKRSVFQQNDYREKKNWEWNVFPVFFANF